MNEYEKKQSLDNELIFKCAARVVEGTDMLKKWSETI